MALDSGGGGGGWFQQLLIEWAAWLVAALASLLYALTREMAGRDRTAYNARLAEFKETLDKTISKDDFEKHEQREDKDRDERRAAEQSIREQLEVANFERRQSEVALREQMQALHTSVDVKIGAFDTKMDAKLTDLNRSLLMLSERRGSSREN